VATFEGNLDSWTRLLKFTALLHVLRRALRFGLKVGCGWHPNFEKYLFIFALRFLSPPQRF
jgi:hypothetical protein